MLTDKLRAELQQPFGELCSNANCAEKLRVYSKIVSVGDITTYNIVQAGIVPDVSIIDGITMRQKVPDDIYSTISIDPRVNYEVNNPAGSVSQQLYNAIRSSMERIARSELVRIVVNGEEDLAVIPAVVEAPLGAAVVYGQPNKGMVIIAITEERKKKAKQLMRELLKITSKDSHKRS
ncbi:MAG: GTP-dependent dephospho-CoA kinase family protein [Halobacteriota archaeon]